LVSSPRPALSALLFRHHSAATATHPLSLHDALPIFALRYANHRRQFGPTSEPETLLLHYPTHQRRLLPGLAAAYAYHFAVEAAADRKSTRLNSSHVKISYAVSCLKKKIASLRPPVAV